MTPAFLLPSRGVPAAATIYDRLSSISPNPIAVPSFWCLATAYNVIRLEHRRTNTIGTGSKITLRHVVDPTAKSTTSESHILEVRDHQDHWCLYLMAFYPTDTICGASPIRGSISLQYCHPVNLRFLDGRQP